MEKMEHVPHGAAENDKEKEMYELVKNELINDLGEKLRYYARSNAVKDSRKVEKVFISEYGASLNFANEKIFLKQVLEIYEKGNEKDVDPLALQIADIIKEKGQNPESITYIIDSYEAEIHKKSPNEPNIKEDVHLEATIPYEELKDVIEEVAKKLEGEITEVVMIEHNNPANVSVGSTNEGKSLPIIEL